MLTDNGLSQSTHTEDNKKFIVFSVSSSKSLTLSICNELGIRPGKAVFGHFKNGETTVEVMESVCGLEVFLVQTGCDKINDNLIELLHMINSCRYASAAKITIILPCYPYSRQDGKKKSRITAKLVADLIACARADHVITMDLHSSQTEGFFRIPLDNLGAEPVLVDWIIRNFPNYRSAILVSPDAGGTNRAVFAANCLGIEFAVIRKKKDVINQVSNTIIVGNVLEKDVILIDDMIDTGKTILRAVKKLKEARAQKIYVLCVHGLFSCDAVDKLRCSPIETLVVTNTIDNIEKLTDMDNAKVIDIGPIFAQAIRQNVKIESTSELFLKSHFQRV